MQESKTVDWHAAYQRGETPWDRGGPAPPLLEFLAGCGDAVAGGNVLVPGCGFGHDARALAAAGARRVVGMDIAPGAVARASELAGGLGAVEFECSDFFELPPHHRSAFDWVFEHTCISGLSPGLRPRYAESVHAALKPGGRYLAIFFMTPWDEDETPEPPPWGICEAEIEAMFGARFRTEREWTPSQSYPGREGREQMRLMMKV